MPLPVPNQEENNTATPPTWASQTKQAIISELRKQRSVAAPLIPMNSTWFARTAITTAFLGRLGELPLAAGTLGFTFANVTGFSVLSGLCWAMEPICGQAHGAHNKTLLNKTLFMTIILLLAASLPISFLWLYVDRILALFGQQKEIVTLAKHYVLFLLPDLIINSFLSPFKAYLSSQGVTLPIMLSSAIALSLHVPFNIFLSKTKGLEGISMAIGLTDLVAMTTLGIYIFVTNAGIEKGDGGEAEVLKEPWWRIRKASEWARLLKLGGQCCATCCLEWWCYEILTLTAGWLPSARQSVSVLAIVLNFDYLLYGVMVSLATCVSTRVSNELGAGRHGPAREAGYVSLGLGILSGLLGGSAMVGFRGNWGPLFTHEKVIIEGVKKMLMLMAIVEVFNFPIAVCGGMVRGTHRPWLGMYSVVGSYLVGLPLGIILGFKFGLGLSGLLMGFVVGSFCSAIVLGVVVAHIDWEDEASVAKELACDRRESGSVSEEINEG
ncbi:Protein DETOXIFICATION 56 [Ananas comosus]|uniref:Protein DETOXIFICATION n=1 Tax=Ananas comosus TaxID=4615 RepID=A0A199UTV4_ANACO|nr:Protein DETOXIFICATION 56 [Ananas comosus]